MTVSVPEVPRAELAEEIARAARTREAQPDFPAGRIARIRGLASRLGATDAEPGDLRHAAVLLERQATIDLQVPTASQVPGVRIVKRAIKALVVWYLRFLGAQITAFGQATARFGVMVASRVDDLDARVGALEERLDRLEGDGNAKGGS
jgi:hypothetical protein